MTHPHLPCFLAALVLVSAGPSPGSASPSVQEGREPTLASDQAVSPSLAAGLEAIRAEAIRADVFFLASDAMRGRDTPSPELRVAARYVRSRLQRLGFQPGARDGFFHTYPLCERTLDEERSLALVRAPGAERRLAFGEDYFFYSTRSLVDDRFEGEVVFCGEGDKDEVRDLALDGKWALCFDSDATAPRVRKNVQRRGAGGVLVMPRPSTGEDPFPSRFEKVVEMTRRGPVYYPRDEEVDEDEPRRPFPQLFLSHAAGLALLEASPARAGASAESWSPAVGTPLGVTFLEQRVAGGLTEVENVCGFWPGDDPELADEVIIVSAHYDHVGARGDEIYNGADDNASGSTGLLALAEGLAAYGPMRRSVMLIWLSGEEKGLWGSRAWTEDPWLPGDARPFCDLNIDMIGRNAPDYLLITPTSERPEYNALTKMAEANGPIEGFGPLGSADEYWFRSDHANFARNLDIPVAFLFSDVHEDYHQPTDVPEKIDCDKIRRVTRLVLRMLDGLQTDEVGF